MATELTLVVRVDTNPEGLDLEVEVPFLLQDYLASSHDMEATVVATETQEV